MLYIYFLIFLIMVVLGFLGAKFTYKKSNGFEALNTLCVVLALVSGVATLTTGLVAGMALVFSSYAPMPKYTAEVLAAAPGFKGTFSCKNRELIFNGSKKVQFKWEGKKYRLDYPVNISVNPFNTYCSFNLKPSVNVAAAALKESIEGADDAVLEVLQSQEVSGYYSLPEQETLSKVLNTFYPEQPVVTDLESDAATKRFKSIDTGASTTTKIVVPYSKQAPISEGVVDLNLLNNNISGQ